VSPKRVIFLEAWFPGQGRYREITSTSNTTDFQSRRLEVRFRRAGKPEPVHTLNGTAITARAMIAILENFQDADGSIAVPNVLWEFGAPRKMGSKQASVRPCLPYVFSPVRGNVLAATLTQPDKWSYRSELTQFLTLRTARGLNTCRRCRLGAHETAHTDCQARCCCRASTPSPDLVPMLDFARGDISVLPPA
jgi:hypothetical protein